MSHGVGSDNSNMIEVLWLFNPHSSNFLCHKVNQLISNFHSQDKFIAKKWSKGKKKSTIPTTNINNGYIISFKRVFSLIFIEWWMFYRITVRFDIVLLWSSKAFGIMCPPINIGMMRWIRKRCRIKWINMCSHSIIFLLRKQSFLLDDFPCTIIVVWLFWVKFLSFHKRNNMRVMIYMSDLLAG